MEANLSNYKKISLQKFKLCPGKYYISLFKLVLFILLLVTYSSAQCQIINRNSLNKELPNLKVSNSISPLSVAVKQYDVTDLIKDILHPHQPASLVVEN